MKRVKLTSKKTEFKKLIKTITVFLIYFGYSYVFSNILINLGLDTILSAFIGDFIFMIFIIFMYWKDIKEDFSNLSKKCNNKIGKLIKLVLMWFIILFISKILVALILETFIPNLSIDENTSKIYKIADLSFVYIAFKTMIFAVIAEELLFRESIRKIIKSDILFILISSLLYTLMNFLYADLNIMYIGIYLLLYFIPALIMSFAYIRNNDNILLIMLIKFFFNLVPFIILTIEILNK